MATCFTSLVAPADRAAWDMQLSPSLEDSSARLDAMHNGTARPSIAESTDFEQVMAPSVQSV